MIFVRRVIITVVLAWFRCLTLIWSGKLRRKSGRLPRRNETKKREERVKTESRMHGRT